MKAYEVLITKRHWVTVHAGDDAEAFELAEEIIPTFSSAFEDTDMDIVGVKDIEE